MTTNNRASVIIVGYDGTEQARAAVKVAAARAGRGGQLVVVHAYGPQRPLSGLSARAGGTGGEPEGHGRVVLAAMSLMGDEVVDIPYETVLIEGPAAAGLAEVARQLEADEIVVGARGLGGVQALLGSVSGELLRIADRPVVVVPAAAVDRILATQSAAGSSR